MSEMRDAMLGAVVSLEGLDRAQSCCGCALGPGHFSSKRGHRPQEGAAHTKPNTSWRSAGLFLANSIKFFLSVPSI